MTLAVVILLDLAVIGYGVFAVYRLTQVRTGMTVIFAIIEIAAIVIAVLTTKETVKNGLLLRATDFEFTGMDKDNVYAYNQIKDITGYKDEAPSLVKNFIDRHAVLSLTLTDDTTGSSPSSRLPIFGYELAHPIAKGESLTRLLDLLKNYY